MESELETLLSIKKLIEHNFKDTLLDCDCGSQVKIKNYTKHLKTKKHT